MGFDRRKEALGKRIHRDADRERARRSGLVFDAGDQQLARPVSKQLGGARDAGGGERRVQHDRDGNVLREESGEGSCAVLEAAIAGVEHDEIDVTALERGGDAFGFVDAVRGDDGALGAECGSEPAEEEIGEERDDDHVPRGVESGGRCLIRALSCRGRAQVTTGVSANMAASLHDAAPRLETGRWSDAAHTGRSHASSSRTHPLPNGGTGCRVYVTHGASDAIVRRADHDRAASERDWWRRVARALSLDGVCASHR